MPNLQSYYFNLVPFYIFIFIVTSFNPATQNVPVKFWTLHPKNSPSQTLATYTRKKKYDQIKYYVIFEHKSKYIWTYVEICNTKN
jgi:hypothetical protein